MSSEFRIRQNPVLVPAGKRRVFMAVTIAFPAVLLCIFEISLRLLHYGPDLSLFTTEVVNGRVYHVMNPEVRSRYFADMDFVPSTSVDDFLVPKPEGTFRIFCLGGSTTVGYPYWYNGSFSTFLRERLQRTFPERSVEVINLGMTATNSFTVLDIAREIMAYEPDLIVVYDGHNEFYGALGVSSNESPGKSRWLTESYLRLIHFRTFLLLRDAYGGVRRLFAPHTDVPSHSTMMEKMSYGNYVPYGSPTYRRGLAIFRENLAALASLCRANRIPLILGTQVSNLRDQPPLVPGNSDEKPAEDRSRIAALLRRGTDLRLAGSADSALASYRAALRLDSLRSDSHYLIARCLDSLGDRNSARSEYVRARDLDQLRFRTSSDFNDAIRKMDDGGDVSVVDMEGLFGAFSPDSLIGRTLIMEHLHPNSRGYFLMGKGFAGEMRRRALLAPAQEWNSHDTIAEADLWHERSVSMLDELIARRRTEILTSGWPFNTQKVPVVSAVSPGDTLRQIAEMVTRGMWDWSRAHREAASYYEHRSDWENLAWEQRVLMSQMPLDVEPYLSLAHLYLLQKDYRAMVRTLLRSQSVRPTILACRALGDYFLQTGNPEAAVRQYEQISGFEQGARERLENGYLLALAYLRANHPDRAAEQLRKLLELDPAYKPASDLLSRLSAGPAPHG